METKSFYHPRRLVKFTSFALYVSREIEFIEYKIGRLAYHHHRIQAATLHKPTHIGAAMYSIVATESRHHVIHV